MNAFTFQTTGSVIVEPGGSRKLGTLIADLGCARVLVVTDSGIVGAGLAEAAIASFASAGLQVSLFTEVEADPPESIILKALAQARANDVDGVVGFGGGSSMDVAKLVAFLLGSDQNLEEIYGIDLCRGDRAPLALVPTTAGTGSEVTPISIVTTGASEKKGVVSRQLLPDWAVLDADLTLGLPGKITAATGIDAMVHAIEAYTSKIRKNPISDSLAMKALSLLGANIRLACADGGNREARGNMLLGSMLAGMAFTNAPVAAVHALAYPLGGHFHVSHGLSNSLVLPHVMRFNMPCARDAFATLAPIVFQDMSRATSESMALDMADRFATLAEDLGLETRLAQVGVSEDQVQMLADDAMRQTRILVNNPREVSRDDALDIYRQAL